MRDRLDSKNCCRYLKALADPERLRIIQCLQAGPRQAGEIGRLLDSPAANVSHHLKQLRIAGLISSRKEGRFVIYALEARVVEEVSGGPPSVLDFGCCRLELGRKAPEAK